MNEYKLYKNCRFCNSGNLIKVINLGKMPLAGGFLKNDSDFKKEKKYLLELLFCSNCYLLQTSVSINPNKLFKNYFYFSSSIKTLVDHFHKNAKDARKRLKKGDFVVEIGCNDGEFLKALEKNKFQALGVDPASNIVSPLIKKGLPIINSFFTKTLAKKIAKTKGQANAIYSFHSLAHIEDMHDVLKGVKKLLNPNGYLAFEVHYLGNLLNEMQYDMIYHEHLHYYSLLTLIKFFDQYDMEIFDVKKTPLRAGSIMYFVQNKQTGGRKISARVDDLIKREKRQGLDKAKTYSRFNNKIERTKKDLINILDKIKEQNVPIAGYGASGRGTVILNYCGLNKKYLDFVVDDSSAKQDYFMPGTHNPICPSSKLLIRGCKYSVVFAWPFINEVLKRNKEYRKNGGKFIVPLPKVKII